MPDAIIITTPRQLELSADAIRALPDSFAMEVGGEFYLAVATLSEAKARAHMMRAFVSKLTALDFSVEISEDFKRGVAIYECKRTRKPAIDTGAIDV